VTSLKERLGALTPYQRFSLFLAGALLLGAVALSVTIATIIERFVAQDTAVQTAREVEVHYPTIFGDQIFRRPFSREEQVHFDRTVRLHLDVYDVVWVRMYQPNGTIVYGYDPALVGRSVFHDPDADLARRAAAGEMSYLMTTGSIAKPPPAAPASAAHDDDDDDEYGYGAHDDDDYGYGARNEYGAHAEHAAAPSAPAAAAPAATPAAAPDAGPRGNVMRLWVPVHRDGGVIGVAQVDRNVEPMLSAVRQMQLLTSGLVVLGAVLLFLALRRVYADATDLLQAREAAERSARAQVAALEELSRFKDEFVWQVNHELRGPLAPIIGYAELLAEQPVPSEQVSRYAGMIHEGAGRLQRLVEDLLDLSRLESGRYRLERRPLSLGALLDRSVQELGHLSTRHTIVLEGLPDLPSIDADPDRLAQVITNLVTNAVRYSPDGGQIRVRAEVRDGAVVTSVADQGIGIPADRLGRIFEKFYRVDNRVTRAVGGTGLGLAICRELIQAHGGDVWVESTAGVGSTFSFSLPLARETPVSAPGGEPEGAAA
jgi:signal transduction histidine kinase